MEANEIDGNDRQLRIQDLDQYLQQNGLEDGNNTNQQQLTQDQREFANRMKHEEDYKEKILREFWVKDELKSIDEQKDEIEEKEKLLESYRGQILTLIVSDPQKTIQVNLFQFAEKCDTIYALAKSDQWSNFMSHKECDQSMEPKITFELTQFDYESIHEFIALVEEKKTVEDISPDHIIECCRIGHFLQSHFLLEQIVDIIKQSIDSDNCASICVLADQLQVSSLMHASMEYVMDRLDIIKSHVIWDDFPQSLRHHVVTLRNAAQSSIITRGHTGKVMFTSSHEFLGIFSDTLREHKERLAEAKLRQEEIIQERRKSNETGGRYAREVDIYGGTVMDAAKKIHKQERRVQALETFYREQKSIFAKDQVGCGVFKSNFSL